MDLLGQGLLISLLGMGITFATLGVLILLIHLLRLVFPAKNPEPLEKQPAMPDDAEAERRAAVFAALWYWQSEQARSPELGRRLEHQPGAWRTTPKENIKK